MSDIRFLVRNGATYHDAEDILQDAEVRRLEGGDDGRITRLRLRQQHTDHWRTANCVKRGGRAQHVDADDGFHDPRVATPDELAAHKEEHAALRSAAARLSPRLRAVIEIGLEGKTLKEVAAQLGISEGTVASRRHRAIAELRRLMAA